MERPRPRGHACLESARSSRSSVATTSSMASPPRAFGGCSRSSGPPSSRPARSSPCVPRSCPRASRTSWPSFVPTWSPWTARPCCRPFATSTTSPSRRSSTPSTTGRSGPPRWRRCTRPSSSRASSSPSRCSGRMSRRSWRRTSPSCARSPSTWTGSWGTSSSSTSNPSWTSCGSHSARRRTSSWRHARSRSSGATTPTARTSRALGRFPPSARVTSW